MLGKEGLQAPFGFLKKDCAGLFGIPNPTALLGDLFRDNLTIGPIFSKKGETVSATAAGVTRVTSSGTFNGAEIKINDLAGTFVTGSKGLSGNK